MSGKRSASTSSPNAASKRQRTSTFSTSLLPQYPLERAMLWTKFRHHHAPTLSFMSDDVKTSTSSSTAPPDESDPLQARFESVVQHGLFSAGKKCRQAKIVVIGAGMSGLCCAFELLRDRTTFDVTLLEASHRIGGRVITYREPFADGLHAEGGAMRLPANHWLVRQYLKLFKMENQLESFEQKNKIIYLAGLGKTLTYDQFNDALKAKNPDLLALFPKLKPSEEGKTVDELWKAAIAPVETLFLSKLQYKDGKYVPDSIVDAYRSVTETYDKYTLRTFLSDVAGWSNSCIDLYDLANAHVVFENGFVESWKDDFLSSNDLGGDAGMQQLAGGMDTLATKFLEVNNTLKSNIRYGARVVQVDYNSTKKTNRVTVYYRVGAGQPIPIHCDYVVYAIPYTALRLINITSNFTREKMLAIRTLRYVEVTKILLQFRTRWWEQWLLAQGQGKEGGVVTDLPIRYAMFPPSSSAQFQHTNRGAIMASYTFEQDATELGSMTPEHRVLLAAENLQTICGQQVMENLEVGASQIWPSSEFAGGSAFAYFGPLQKSQLYDAIVAEDWNGAAQFAGEHASYSHGWIQGAFEAGIRVALQIYDKQTE